MNCEPLIDARKAAEMLNCSQTLFKRMAARKQVPAVRIGNRWKSRRSWLDEWMNKQVGYGPSPAPLKEGA